MMGICVMQLHNIGHSNAQHSGFLARVIKCEHNTIDTRERMDTLKSQQVPARLNQSEFRAAV